MRIVIPVFLTLLLLSVVDRASAQAPVAQWQSAPSLRTGAEWPSAHGSPTLFANPRQNVHFFNETFLWIGGGSLVLSYAAKLPSMIALGESSGAHDHQDGSYARSCWDQTTALLAIPVVGGLLGAISGHACENTGYRYNRSGGFEYAYTRTPFDGNDEAAAAAWVGFGLDLIGIVFTTLGLIGYHDIGWDDVTEHEVRGHRLSASLSAPGADIGGVSVTLDL